MSKKNYQAIAQVLYRAGSAGSDRDTTLTSIIQGISDVFAADNPRFDRERFLEACETGKCRGMRQVA